MAQWVKKVRSIKGKRRQVKVARVKGRELVRIRSHRNFTDAGLIKTRGKAKRRR